MLNITIVPEKQTFHALVLVDTERGEVKIYVKCAVNYQRMSQKCQAVFTGIHKGIDFNDAAMEAKDQAAAHCEELLASYRNAYGIGDQPDLFSQPAEPKKRGRPAKLDQSKLSDYPDESQDHAVAA